MADDKKAKKTSEKKTSDKKATSSKNGKSDKKKSGKNPFTAIGSFFKSVRSEGKKVVWPKPLEVLKNTVTVLVVILILGLIIFGIDQALTQGMKGIKRLAEDTTVSQQAEEGSTSEDAASELIDELNEAASGAAEGGDADADAEGGAAADTTAAPAD